MPNKEEDMLILGMIIGSLVVICLAVIIYFWILIKWGGF